MNLNLNTFDFQQHPNQASHLDSNILNSKQSSGNTSTINRINSLAAKKANLSSCLNAIKSISSFLSDESPEVRNYAALVICNLIVQAAEFLSNETSPKVIKEASEFLIDIINQLEASNNMGSISLSKDKIGKLNAALEIINKKLLETTGDFPKQNNSSQSDEFVSTEMQKVIKKLYGDLNVDQFTPSRS